MLIKRVLNIILLLAIIGVNVGGQKLEKVKLQLKWTHQFQFAGYYAAQEKGFYKDAGLDVEIMPASPDINPIENVIRGKADFGVGASDLIRLRGQGIPVVVLASIFQHSPFILLSLKKDGIQTIQELENSTIMVEKDSAEVIAYLKNEGLDLSKIKFISHSYSVKDLINGKADAMTAYVTTEPYELRELGYDYVIYSPRAVGIDFYSDNLFAMESLINDRPTTVDKFREASLKGWYYAMHNQEEIIQIIKSKYGTTLSLEHLRFEAKQMENLLQSNLIEIGHSNPNRWEQILSIYSEMGMAKGAVDINEFLYIADHTSEYKRLYPILFATILLLFLSIFVALRFIHLAKSLRVTVNELTNAKSALNMSENKYQLLIDNNANIIFSLDMQGRLTFVSEMLTKKLGFLVSEVIGKHFDFFIHPNDVRHCYVKFEQALLTGQPQSDIEYRVRTKDGNWLWNSASIAPLKDENGQFTIFIGSAIDITEVKLAQLALQESEAKHRMLTELSGDMIVMHSDFEKYYVNPAVNQMLGYSQEEFLRIGLLDLVHPDDKELVNDNIASDQTDVAHKSYNSDFRIRHKDGHYVDFSAHIIVHKIKDSNHITVINLRNISRKLNDEREIRKLSTAVDQSQSTILITDLEGDIEYVNPHFTKITGYSYDEAIGKNPKILKSNFHSQEFYSEMWATLKSGNTWKGEIYNRRKDGSCYWEEATMAPVFDAKGEMINFVAIKNDITLRKNIESALKEKNEQLQSLIETKNKFISILAHDLRNPFHALLGLSDILINTIKLDDKDAIDIVKALNSTALNTYKLLENILQWANSQKESFIPRIENLNMFNLVVECSNLVYENGQAKGITIQLSVDRELKVMADSEMVKTILRNLLTNAIKFSNVNSIVKVEALSVENYTQIKVIDSGVGMSLEALDSLFKLGSKETSLGTQGEIGTGFGLMICKELVEKHKGTITVESVLGKGTTFTISLPHI